MAQYEYLIVGGGNSAGYACREFVAQGVAAGKVGMIMAEPVVPYERPALTKAYLHPPSAKARARLPGFHTCVGGGGDRQTPEWYAEHNISLIKGKVTAVDLAGKTVTVGGTADIKYEKLLLATGCGTIKVSKFGVKGDEAQNVFYIREEADAAALVKALESLPEGKGKAVIVGTGYIGLECAAALVGWGIEVTVVSPADKLMERLFDDDLSGWMEKQYTSRGIKFVKGDSVTEFNSKDGALEGVTLKSGQKLDCNVAVVGVGASPNVDFISGLKMEKGGVAVDSFMKSSDPSVYAIGDIAAFPGLDGSLVRCEHVDHARKSAAQAVKAAIGVDVKPYEYMPYFYSRVFEYTEDPVIFNFYGDQSGEMKVTAKDEKTMTAVWIKDGKAVGALILGSPGPSGEDAKKLQQIAAEKPAATDVSSAFSAVGL
mmetsp:Transcript_29475/g.43726  ORF Transcript_29475/g.43726 Transcript_29475/m.43726 type:complete len:428 (+) Transcript_29475:1-1284(+)